MLPELSTIRSTWELVVAFILWGGAILSCLLRSRDVSEKVRRQSLKEVVRFLLATSLLLLFLSPQLQRSFKRPAPIAIVVDDSASMTRSLDVDDVRARAEALVAKMTVDSNRDARPSSTSFLSGAKEFSYDSRSPLADVARIPTNARDVFLITDGIANPKLGSTFPTNSSPRVYPIVLGSESPALNWRLVDVTPTATGDEASVTATIELVGEHGERAALVELWRRNEKNERSLAWRETVDAPPPDRPDFARKFTFQRSWSFNSNNAQTWLLLVVDQDDEARYTLESMTLGAQSPARLSESCLADNATSFSLGGASKKTRVLLVDDLPRYEYRYLRETLRREPTVALKTLLLAADPMVAQSDPLAIDAKSLDRRTLSRFDVVVVGDLTSEQWQSALGSLADVVERDGSTTSVWFAGATRLGANPNWRTLPEARLAPGVPVVMGPSSETDAQWSLVDSHFSAVVWPGFSPQNAPELTRVVPSVNPDAKTATLLFAKRSGDEEPTPLILAESRGKNAVLWQSTDELWRLQTLADKSIYRSFVLQTLDYLTTPARREAIAETRSLPLKTTDDVSVDPFAYFAPENASRRAAIRELENVAACMETPSAIAKATGGRTLDLRDLAVEDSKVQTQKFWDELEERLASETIVAKTPLIPTNLIYSVTILLFLLAIFL